jgi:hypothetical protein
MYLKTKKQILINDGLTSEKMVILTLKISRVILVLGGNTEVQYEYSEFEGPIIGSLRNVFFSPEETDALYKEIKSTLPVGLTDSQHQEIKFYTGAKIQMWQNFKVKNPDLQLRDIEIIGDSEIQEEKITD